MENQTQARQAGEEKPVLNFIEQIIEEDLQNAKHSTIHTRFPPEPNGYLHIGHAKSICLNFGLGIKYKGKTNLRFDDTNPTTEDTEYVDSIREDIKWLGFDWEDREYYASDYFEQLYIWAVHLIKTGKAYVCELSAEEVSAMRGTPTRPGQESPYRNRPLEESLNLFERMRAGEFPDGKMMLRAKIDMASPNMHMRDPVLYRIRHAHHHRTGDKWCIYPMYDYAHGQSDYIEGITHSICTLEFEVHRPLYDWFLDQIADRPRPRQIEFARLNISYMVMSKRKLLQLVKEGYVNGWDDPRMPTICGLRRRGYTPEAIRTFAERVGVAKRDNVIDLGFLEFCIREDLNKRSQRRMAVINPLKITLVNFPENSVEMLEAVNNPENPDEGTRMLPFGKTLYIEQDDFMEDAPGKFFRLKPGGEVRLKYAYIIKCEDVIKDATGNVTELLCTYYPLTRSGMPESNRKVKATIHWVSAQHAVEAEVRLYDRLFVKENPEETEEGQDFKSNLNPDSLIVKKAFGEPSLADVQAGEKLQFERIGYFMADYDTLAGRPVFNRTVTLKDAWAKAQQ